MENKDILKEETKNYMKEYYEKHGIGGLLGIIIEIDREKVDKKDIEKHQMAVESERNAKVIEHDHLTQFVTPNIKEPKMEASIYAEEHIPAVQDDLQEKQEELKNQNNSAKVKILEPEQKVAPNPWQDAEVVTPGQLKLK